MNDGATCVDSHQGTVVSIINSALECSFIKISCMHAMELGLTCTHSESDCTFWSVIPTLLRMHLWVQAVHSLYHVGN